MRQESIPNSDIVVHWRDEREGRALVRDGDEWAALLAAFGFADAKVDLPSEPQTLENAQFRLVSDPEHAFPAIVRVQRKPQNALQEAAWNFADQTRMAQIEEKEGQLGVHFLDEDRFVPFADLEYEPGQGFRMTGAAAAAALIFNHLSSQRFCSILPGSSP